MGDKPQDVPEVKKLVRKELNTLQPKSTSRMGQAGVYRDKDDKPVPVSPATHYMWRDVESSPELEHINALEFETVFKVVKMDDNDKEWRHWKLEHKNLDRPLQVGRPKERHLLYGREVYENGEDLPPTRTGHPLFDSHIIIRKAKWGVPAFAGAAPPRDPATNPRNRSAVAAVTRQQHGHARYMLAVFKPWSHENPLETSDPVGQWTRYIADLNYEACFSARLRTAEAPDGSNAAEVALNDAERIIATGRLFAIQGIIIGFRTNREVAVMLAKHRSRSATICNSKNKPCGLGGGDLSREAREALKQIASLNEKSNKARGGVNILKRIENAKKASAWENTRAG